MGLKNGSGIAAAMAKVADWALNEQCNRFHECGDYASFIALNKAVFNVEYTRPDGMTLAAFCPADNQANFDGILKLSSDTLARCRVRPAGSSERRRASPRAIAPAAMTTRASRLRTRTGRARRRRCGIDSIPVRGPLHPGRPLTQVNPIPHASHTVESNARAMPHATARRMRDGGGEGAGLAQGVFMPPAGGRIAMRCGAG